MRRLAAITLVLLLAGGDVRRVVLAGSGGAFTPPPTAYSMLYNGSAGSGIYDLGQASSTDAGVTWAEYGSNPIISHGAGGTWNDVRVHAPNVIWDGTQTVLFADGYDGANWRIGRWTNPNRDWAANPGSWTQYGSNPIIGLGAGGSWRETGIVAPQVTYDASLTPPWKMWAVGFDASSVTRVGFLDSSDGITWTDRGIVVDLGAGGTFNDEGVGLGCAILVGSTWTLFVAGQSATGAHFDYRAGYTTVAVGSEATAASYATPTVISAFSGQLVVGGLTYRSNTLTSVIARGSTYLGYGTMFDPTTGVGHEIAIASTSTDLVTWTAPTGPLLPLAGWSAISAENPSVTAP